MTYKYMCFLVLRQLTCDQALQQYPVKTYSVLYCKIIFPVEFGKVVTLSGLDLVSFVYLQL